MRYQALTIALLSCAALSCSRRPALKVEVDGIPKQARSLQVLVVSQDSAEVIPRPTQIDPEPWDIPDDTTSRTSFVLNLPEHYQGKLTVSVAAFDHPGLKGCIIGLGEKDRVFMPTPLDDSMYVTLTPSPTDHTCEGAGPRVLAVAPGQGGSDGGTTGEVIGWRFKPGAKVLVDAIAAPNATYESASRLQVTMPPGPACGRANLAVVNLDNTQGTLPAAYRYIPSALSFAPGLYGYPGGIRAITFGQLDPLSDPNQQMDFVITTNQSPTNYIYRVLKAQLTSSIPPRDLQNDDWSPAQLSDVDLDGDLDIVAAGRTMGGVVMWKNDGQGWFALGGSFVPGEVGSIAISVGDLNLDGYPDVASVNETARTVNIYLNDRTGSIPRIPTHIAIKKIQNPSRVAVLHTTADAYLDVVVADRLTGSLVQIPQLLNGQTAAFPANDINAPVHELGGPAGPLVRGDLDGDGLDDLVVPIESRNNLQIFLSTDRPNWTPHQIDACTAPRAATIADMNCDGQADIIIGCGGAQPSVQILLRQVDGSYKERWSSMLNSTGSMPTPIGTIFDLAAGDVTDDGKPDIMLATDVGIAYLRNTMP